MFENDDKNEPIHQNLTYLSPYYQAPFTHANHSLKAIEMSFVLIRLISDTNQRRWVLTFIFPPTSQFQNINVLDGLIEPDNEFSSDAGSRVILLFFFNRPLFNYIHN